MNLWFKYSVLNFLRLFLWSLLFSTVTVTILDCGNRWSSFENDVSLMFEYYSLQCVPFLLLSIPFCLFLSLALCVNKFRVSKELSLVHVYAKNSWQMIKPILLMMFVIIFLWLILYECIWSDLRWKYLSLNGTLNKKNAHSFRINHDKGFLFIEKCDIYNRQCNGVVLYMTENRKTNKLFPPSKLHWKKGSWHVEDAFIEKMPYQYKKFYQDKILDIMVSPEEILFLNGMQNYLSTSELLNLVHKHKSALKIVILRLIIVLLFAAIIGLCLRHLFIKVNVSVGKITFIYFFAFLVSGFIAFVALQA